VENPSDELELFDPIALNETSAASEARQMLRRSVHLHSSSAKSLFLLHLFQSFVTWHLECLSRDMPLQPTVSTSKHSHYFVQATITAQLSALTVHKPT
jgi:hypothetical protein